MALPAGRQQHVGSGRAPNGTRLSSVKSAILISVFELRARAGQRILARATHALEVRKILRGHGCARANRYGREQPIRKNDFQRAVT
jgi:hypothetical protein